MKDRNWHNLSATETIESLGSSRQGLSREEAQRRLSQFGPNELEVNFKMKANPDASPDKDARYGYKTKGGCLFC